MTSEASGPLAGTLIWVASWSSDGHGASVQKLPVSSRLPALTTIPSSPAIILVPPKALSNSWMGKKVRTPRSWISLSPASICDSSHWGTSLTSPQPKMRETSMPSMTASLPSLITRRAWNGSVTMRNHPLPGPPDWASM